MFVERVFCFEIHVCNTDGANPTHGVAKLRGRSFIGAQAWTIVLATCAMGISMNQRSLLRCSDSKDIIRVFLGISQGSLFI